MTAALLAGAAAAGVFLVYSDVVFGAPRPARPRPPTRGRVRVWAGHAGIDGVSLVQLAAATAALFVVSAALTFAVFGSLVAAVVAAGFVAALPAGSCRARRQHAQQSARDAWPRLIEEIRLQTGALGRSVPQALFDVGQRGPSALRPAFEAAHREWVMSTDFSRTVAVLKDGLADATADAVCETLLVAHDLGGRDLDQRLEALIEDRIVELEGRKEARAKQAGVRFARRFVLLVPLGMALSGLSIGNGRAAYGTPEGQLAAVAGIVMVVACWVWAGRLMRLPAEDRVFG